MPGLAQQRVGVLVALVGDDDAGLEGDDVVAVVPLLALGLPAVAAGADDAQLLEPERVRDGAEERVLAADVELARLVGRADRVGGDRVDDLREQRHAVAVEEREHRVEVHVRAVARHARRDRPGPRRPAANSDERDLLDHLPGRALAHADGDRAVADGHDVAALGADPAERLALLLPRVPELEAGVAEERVEAVDGLDVERLEPAGRPVHRVDHDAAVDPGRGVAGEVAVRAAGGGRSRPASIAETTSEPRRDRARADVAGRRVPRRISTASRSVRPPMRWSARTAGSTSSR